MPILKPDELGAYIGETFARLMTQDARSFEQTEQSAADLIHARTGLVIPDDADNAPAWAKEASAYIIQFKRIGVLANLTVAKAQSVQAQYRAALESLDMHKQATPTGRPGAEWGEIQGVLKW